MAIFNFFRTPKPQQFRYVPRHYDPEREEIKRRLAQLNPDEVDNSAEAMKHRISAGFKRKQSADPTYRKRHTKRSNRMLAAIIVLLIVISVIMIERYLPALMQALE